MFDFLGRNIIAPDSIVRDIKRYRTISTKSDVFLFVTHKKLNRKSRENGIAEPEFVYPITLELSDSQKGDGQAILVSQSEDSINFALATLQEYDPEKHIGAYLFGEIPLSRVEKIYFDTQDEMDMFSRPSPDYWYPTDKYALLPDEDFSEELEFAIADDDIIAESGLKREAIIEGFRTREKHRAALLNFINGTKRWQQGKYVFNIDSRFQKLLALDSEDLSSVLPHYAEADKTIGSEQINLVNESEETNSSINQVFYDHICDALILQPYNTQKQPDIILGILNAVWKKVRTECHNPNEENIVKTTLTEIGAMIADTSDKSPEEIMAGIVAEIDVLKALLFVAKNPNRYDVFLDALDVYHVNQITKRRAMVLWGMLNGLCGMPGENHNKDNQQLWQFIEAYVCKQGFAYETSLSVSMPKTTIKSGTVLEIKLKEERILSANEVREAILITAKKNLSNAFYEKLLEAAISEFGSKKKADSKGYTCVQVSKIDIDIHFEEGYVPGTNDWKMIAEARKLLANLEKAKKEPKPNKSKLFKDYVEVEEKFQYVFGLDPEYWKKVFSKLSRMNDAEL